ncbi:helix-turn-helix transcriptional regulator [Glycomyces rhizosphaerae]|uniref:Response regulator transcription factor n=1 Tax=Glycomyces rhizosphaerae TaxID=2054422 RepID=A0ABV7Q538_9ACTN
MADPLDPPADEPEVQAVYARMREHGETFTEAAEAIGLAHTDIPRVRRRLAELGLLDGTAEIAVDAAAALTRLLGDGRDRLAAVLAALVERQNDALALASDYVRLADKGRNGAVEVLAKDDTFRPRMESLLDHASASSRRELVAMHPHAVWDERFLEDGLRRTVQQTERGLSVRTLYAQQTLRQPSLREYIRRKTAAGMLIKAAPITPIRMLVYDRELAIVDAPRDEEIGAIVIRDRLLAEPLVDFFEYCWITASDLDEVLGSTDGSGLTEQQTAVLRLLASGAKDEAIARSLGVSVRTVTRIVAELTSELGATSRFQAGVLAARLGWLD